MGLFDAKYCDVCGNKIKFLGNKKLEDANLCKDCASKLSPWFSGRRHSTLEDIKAQLQYREENKAEVEKFHVTRSIGRNEKLLIDEDAGKFTVTSSSNLKADNPDIIDVSKITGCDLDIQESKSEIYGKDKDGKEVSFNPPRYEYDYDFYITIFVDHPYFDDMRFRLNSSSVETGQMPANATRAGVRVGSSGDYAEYEAMGNEIKSVLEALRTGARDRIAKANEPKRAVKCPHCMATTIPTAEGRCEYCGAPLDLG